MEYLAGTSYYTKTPLKDDLISQIPIGKSLEWGLPDDVVSGHESLLLEDRLVTSIHVGDTFELSPHTVIPVQSRVPVLWGANGKTLIESSDTNFTPTISGLYEISAKDNVSGKVEYIEINVVPTESQ